MSKSIQVSLGRSSLGRERHVCAFFADDSEAYSVLLPFIREGFDCGHRAVHVVSAEQEPHHLEKLSSVGIDSAAALSSGQLHVCLGSDIYLADGRFDQDRMLEFFEEMAGGSAAGGYETNRIVCNMDWAFDDPLLHEELVEFEARVNDVWARHDDIVICVYDVRKVSGSLLVDIIRTHPWSSSGMFCKKIRSTCLPSNSSANAGPSVRRSPASCDNRRQQRGNGEAAARHQ